MKRKIFSVMLSLICLITTLLAVSEMKVYATQLNDTDLFYNNKIKKRTMQEIEDYLSGHLWYEDELSYDVVPNTSSPYDMGKVSDKSLNAGLNALNLVRFVAGLDEVSLTDDYNEFTQAAALVNAANRSLSHYPSQPEGMSDELYTLGKAGASSSNIGMGYVILGQSVIYGYMDDSDSSNRDRAGHRRWCLNPMMKNTGFGFAENGMCRATAMYSFDKSANVKSSEYMVAWPASVMPAWLFSGDLWSFSKSSAFSEDTTVTVVRKSDQKTWVIDKSSKDGYFSVNNDGYGQPGCVIFSPNDVDVIGGETYSVKIVDGDFCKTYDVEFYCEHSYSERVTKAATCTEKGEKEYRCSQCEKSYNEEIPAMGHDYSEKIIAPTYTEKGYTIHECKNCGDSYKDSYTDVLKKETKDNSSGGEKDNNVITVDTGTTVSVPQIKLKSVKNNKKKSITIKWNRNTNVDGYQVVASKKQNFTNSKKKNISSYYNSTTVKGLTKKKTYYVRIRAYDIVDGNKVYPSELG